MQSNLQDAAPVPKNESSMSPRPLKWIIKPANSTKVDANVGGDGSIGSLTEEIPQSQLDDTSTGKKGYSRSLQPSKKSRKRNLQQAEIGMRNGSDETIGNTSNQLVVYDPDANNTIQDVVLVSDHRERYTSTFQQMMTSNPASRVLPSVGAFTVQCADCFKWRLIPTKEIYEEIREHILQVPFTCERAREWRPDVTCDDPADISQDGSRLWAIDKPNIAQPPPGWERQLRIRGEGSTKFADV